MNARLLFVHALSPLHAGTGQGVGVIDLPIAREKATNLPYLPSSSLKGTLRDTPSPTGSPMTDELRIQIFGPDGEKVKADEHAGSVQFSDQRLLLLPVRSLIGTFAWVTSPYVLHRLWRDAKGAPVTGLPGEVPKLTTIEDCVVAGVGIVGDSQKVYLEDLDLKTSATEQPKAEAWAEWLGKQLFPGDEADSEAWRGMLAERFCIVHDDALSFLMETATEVTARIKMDSKTKTVEEHMLWYEEALPTESILYGLVVATPVRRFNLDSPTIFKALGSLMNIPAQFGGKATVGRGLCRLQIQQ